MPADGRPSEARRRPAELSTPAQTLAMLVEPLDSMTSLTTRIAYGKSFCGGSTAAIDRSASAPWPISRRLVLPVRPVSPTLNGGKL